MRSIYVVRTPTRPEATAPSAQWSYARDLAAPTHLLAFPSARAAARAIAFDDPFIPGLIFSFGDQSPMSSMPGEALAAALSRFRVTTSGYHTTWDAEYGLDFGASPAYQWQTLPAEEIRAIAALFDRRGDSAVVGQLEVEKVDLDEEE